MNDFYKGKRVLVTGGLGFIGSTLALRLVDLGADVLIVDSMIPAYGGNLFNIEPARDRIRVNFSDIRDAYSLDYLVRDQDVLFSLAGQVSHLDSMNDPMPDLEINCRSQLSLLEACRRRNRDVRIIFASTRQMYGRPQYLPVDEDHPLVPIDVNGINKLAGEMYYGLYHETYGIRSVRLRLTNTYGPRMDLRSDSKGFAGIFIRRALLGEKIQIFGDGHQRRDFNHVDDVVDAMLLAGADERVSGECFNLGHARPYRLLEFVETLRRYTNVDFELVPFPSERQAIDIGDYYGSYERFHAATGWEPRHDLDEGLQDTIAYFRRFPDEYL
ncbi:UDP-glucose 4-epimerase [Planctomycetes bacterium Pan216]|uniref:UDP-glucose 4-epimerase n=1 Tax=Kolteria novifilia TaxID=2527975 RepID=A0A518B986_9BACT|nr:UDP-glucose 4-epimerase [Planctomycetes bacterium Pan216]